jgi:ferredoxin-NADP reductase/anaerobic selenocysteine-containing dehydrogenase
MSNSSPLKIYIPDKASPNPSSATPIKTIDHAGFLADLKHTPAYMSQPGIISLSNANNISCSYCGVGDSGNYIVNKRSNDASNLSFSIANTGPSKGCVKLRHSTMNKKVAYPIHTAPSVLDPITGLRKAISYDDAINQLSDMMLDHMQANKRSLVYASGQIDYFAIFAMQEVFRLLGVRNLTGNAEHCLNAGAVHNEMLTGQEGPFLTLDQAMKGDDRLYILNGWNGVITHPPAFNQLKQKENLDAYIFEVMESESALEIAKKIGDERVILIKAKGDSLLAMAVAHEIIHHHPNAVSSTFIQRFANPASFDEYQALVKSDIYSAQNVAKKIAAEPQYEARTIKAIMDLAVKLANPKIVPIVMPSVGLSQSSGVVAHCLWGSLLALVGKFGLHTDSTPLGGVLRLPGQINAESEVQGLSRKYFMGRIPMDQASEAARRMGLPDNAYQDAVNDQPRAALDYSDDTHEDELFLFFGTQFESNMPNRKRWLNKLNQSKNTLVVIDPIPDPWSLKNAHLIIPSPPHPATPKLYQNGEWRLTLSMPQKKAASQTRSDATIIYDVMANITRRIAKDKNVAKQHTMLATLYKSGYLQERFLEPDVNRIKGLVRQDGEVNRAQLFDRIQDYLHGGNGPLYCSFDHANGKPITWQELVSAGNLLYGGVGKNRFMLDYTDDNCRPFKDIYRNPGAFKFFSPQMEDLELPKGIILNSGRGTLSKNPQRIQFATSTFNSGKATPLDHMPDEHPLYVSQKVAHEKSLKTGDWAQLTGAYGDTIDLPVVVSSRVKGDSLYVSFHRARSQELRNLYVNDVTDHKARCRYSSQSQLKIPTVNIHKLEKGIDARYKLNKLDNTKCTLMYQMAMNPNDIPMWQGQEIEALVSKIINETHDTQTYRFIADPISFFDFKPGQFVSVILDIGDQQVQRAYSISSSPSNPEYLDITVKRVPGGLVSNWLSDHLEVGDRIKLKGPLGNFCLEPRALPKKILTLGAGSGITPLMSMARYLSHENKPVDIAFYFSVREMSDVIYGNAIQQLAQANPKFRPIIIPTKQGEINPILQSSGRLSEQLITTLVPDYKERELYICGPEGFMDHAETLFLSLGLDKRHIHKESFAPPATQKASGSYNVTFNNACQTVVADGSHSLLDIAESQGIEMKYGCRTGGCGECKVTVSKGEHLNASTEGLTPDELEQGVRLACMCFPQGDCVVNT